MLKALTDFMPGSALGLGDGEMVGLLGPGGCGSMMQ
jgi:hypothetical protein